MTRDTEEIEVPVVSICMPVYNGEKYLVSALDSVLAQTYPGFEVIVSDNASDDRTQEICSHYCGLDSRIRYYRHEKNRGPNWNFEFAVQKAEGRLMTWFAHDDILEPDFISVCANYLLQHPETVLVTGDFQVIDEKGSELRTETIDQIRKDILWKDRQIEFFKNPNLNVYYCIYGMMRTDACQSIMNAVKKPRLATGSEFPILARFALLGEIVSIPRVLRKYRRHAASVYMRETAEAAKTSKVRRLTSRLMNIYRLRFEQMTVLFSSSLSFWSKCRIFLLASLAHKQLFFRALFRGPFKDPDF